MTSQWYIMFLFLKGKSGRVVIFNTVVVVLLKWRINIAIAYVLEMIYNNCGYRLEASYINV